MNPPQIRPIPTHVRTAISAQKFTMPEDLRAKVEAFWQEHTAGRHRFFNGEVFTITDFHVNDEELFMHMAETDFKHHFYSEQVGDLGEYNTRTLHTSILVITADDYLICGKMDGGTARGGLIVCSGGKLDREDFIDGQLDMAHASARELREELGLDVNDHATVTSFEPAYITAVQGKVYKLSVVFITRTSLTKDQFVQNYNQFMQHNEPEFDELYFIPNTPQAVEAFLAEHSEQVSLEVPLILRQVVQ